MMYVSLSLSKGMLETCKPGFMLISRNLYQIHRLLNDGERKHKRSICFQSKLIPPTINVNYHHQRVN